MSPDDPPRILLATAGFGEGHHSAARNLAKALHSGASVEIADPCREGAPVLNDLLRSAYRVVTTYSPRLWKRIYHSVEKRDFSKERIPFMRLAEKALAARINAFDPHVIVSTYPLYPYFVRRYFDAGGRSRPLVTVVTDSIEINAAWRFAPTDYWLVTDAATRRSLIERELPEERVVDTGFPIDPVFNTLSPLSADGPAKPFRVLFFPTAKRPTVRRIARAVLDHPGWPTEITIVLGRNFRRLYRRAREIKDAYPGRVRVRGWSKRVPQLLCEHHLVIGKAGGATVHEALGARCPMLIHHLVPGQEEGNLDLLRQIGGGSLAHSEDRIRTALRDLLADNAAGWRRQKRALARHARPNAALSAATFILQHA